MSTHFLLSKVCWQHPAFFALFPQANFPANNLNFHWRWRWWDWIQAIFLNLFYLKAPETPASTNRFDKISKNIQGKASNSSNLEVKENDKSGVLYKHKFRENLQVYLDPVTKELASKPSQEVMDYLEETPSITLKDWITAGIFFKAKPSLKISTASAIFWIYFGIFSDYRLRNTYIFWNNTFLFLKI